MASESLVEIVGNVLKSKISCQINHNSVIELLFDLLNKIGSRITLVDNDSDRKWSACELREAIITIGSKLLEAGVSKGDVVAFFCPNSDLHVIAMLSVWAIGAVSTGLIHQSPLRELKNVIQKTNAVYLIGSKETIDICNDFISESDKIKKFFIIDDCSGGNTDTIHFMLKSIIKDDKKKAFLMSMSSVKPTDVCKISFSSGTTGEPKAVLETHLKYMTYTKFSDPKIKILNSEDIGALFPPLSHQGGTVVLCMVLLNSACVVIFSHFDVNTFFGDFQRHKVTYSLIVPAYLAKINTSLSAPVNNFYLKKVVTGGEKANEFISKESIQLLKLDYFSQIWGSTEAGCMTIMPNLGINHLICVGQAIPGSEMKFVDVETGETLGANKKGEICVKGPELTPGYLNNENANHESFDENGFYKTGDIGYFDDKGYIYIVDRIKEIIKYNTQQVSPTELESILLQHNSVQEVAVIGIPNEMYGQLPKAFVVLKQDFRGKVKKEELLQFLNSQVMDFKKLRGGLAFLSEFPRTSLGKINKNVLKSL